LVGLEQIEKQSEMDHTAVQDTFDSVLEELLLQGRNDQRGLGALKQYIQDREEKARLEERLKQKEEAERVMREAYEAAQGRVDLLMNNLAKQQERHEKLVHQQQDYFNEVLLQLVQQKQGDISHLSPQRDTLMMSSGGTAATPLSLIDETAANLDIGGYDELSEAENPPMRRDLVNLLNLENDKVGNDVENSKGEKPESSLREHRTTLEFKAAKEKMKIIAGETEWGEKNFPITNVATAQVTTTQQISQTNNSLKSFDRSKTQLILQSKFTSRGQM